MNGVVRHGWTFRFQIGITLATDIGFFECSECAVGGDINSNLMRGKMPDFCSKRSSSRLSCQEGPSFFCENW